MHENTKMKQCPTTNCKGISEFENKNKLFLCGLCGICYCLRCKVNWKPDHNCEELEKVKTNDKLKALENVGSLQKCPSKGCT